MWLCQDHAGLRNALCQQATEAVPRERIEIERAHALQAERAGEVVDRAARAGAQTPVGLFDQVDERFAGGGDLQGVRKTRENHN
ncbi:hypothetical protein FQZ97_855330 [compost metagenome]